MRDAPIKLFCLLAILLLGGLTSLYTNSNDRQGEDSFSQHQSKNGLLSTFRGVQHFNEPIQQNDRWALFADIADAEVEEKNNFPKANNQPFSFENNLEASSHIQLSNKSCQLQEQILRSKFQYRNASLRLHLAFQTFLI